MRRGNRIEYCTVKCVLTETIKRVQVKYFRIEKCSVKTAYE